LKLLKRIGIIDIGSNSIRLVVFDGPKRSPLYLYNEKVFFRLGLQSFGGKPFGSNTLEAVSHIIKRYVAICRNMEISKIIMFGTSALREASNSNVLVESIREKTNVDVDIISGEKEAFYAAQGILLGFPNAEGVICDLGGNSVEFANIRKNVVTECNSVLLGPLTIKNLGEKCKNLDDHMKNQLATITNFNGVKNKSFFLIGGSWRAIAKIHMQRIKYPLKIIQGYKVESKKLKKTLEFIQESSFLTKSDEMNISLGRLELLPQAARLLKIIIDEFEIKVLTFSSFGVREGLIYEHLSVAEKKRDPLIEAAKFFEKKETRFPKMSKHTFNWISPLYENLPPKTKRVILAATKLHDIAWIAHPDYKTEMCLEIVTRSNISGISHQERVFLAMILLFRHKAKPEKIFNSKLFKIVPKKKRKIALVIGKGLRLASTFFGEKSLLNKIEFRLRANEVDLCFQSKMDSINGEIVEKRIQELNKALKTCVTVNIEKKKF
jgi:exopolyphosphatase/guanosine-5'-triphosphate,3'-diphosphate pyrophosphatase